MGKYLIGLLAAGSMLAMVSLSATEVDGLQVIVNPANPVKSLPREEVSAFLLKKRTRWDNGEPVMPIDLIRESPIRESFCKLIHRRSVKNIETYWNRKIFTGDDVPPPRAQSEREVIEYVAGHPGAIGYVSASAPLSGVKPIEVEIE
ncbi:MAG: hypothetical protein D6696_08350 [Acidobacteria bacterium]|nr:MAG: hypothetical protein D6696_08350 [Acidobacteriota bacterium]